MITEDEARFGRTSPPPPRNRSSATLAVVAVIAVVALAVVAMVVVAGGDGDGGTMSPGSMMGGGRMTTGWMGGSMAGPGTSSPTIAGARIVAVTAASFRFTPAEIRVKAGEAVTVELTATDVVHDFTIDDLGFRVAAVPGQPGRGSFRAPSAPATYTAYCTVTGHRPAGMTATVVVDPS